MNALEKQIFTIASEKEFREISLRVFNHQARNNKVYAEYLDILGIPSESIKKYQDIPFLPVEIFKEREVICEAETKAKLQFTSSGSTGMNRSTHHVLKPEIYRESFRRSFQLFYGNPGDFCFMALLPSYLEREGSSLIYMMEDLIKSSKYKESGFFLHNQDELAQKLQSLAKRNIPTVLLGVSYALLDLAQKYPMDLKNFIIMETGGMKGQRKEMIKEEFHAILQSAFNTSSIHSEYGMTELLSQAYSKANGRFFTPPWMSVLIRDSYDPFRLEQDELTGGINVIDLANLYSCSFIATSDLGKKHADGSFEVSGRFDHSDIRGCNLLL